METTTEDILNETLGHLVAGDSRKAEIFKKYGLDFCCGGKKTVRQACGEKGLDTDRVEQELRETGKMAASRHLPYNEWPLDFLADYIVNTHHSYVKRTLPDLKAYAGKVAKVHGGQHPELEPIRQLVQEVNDELTEHLYKEERVLFPYIKALVTAKNGGQPLQTAGFGTVQNPIRMMETEHETVGKSLARIRELSRNYVLPEDACATYGLLYKMLEEFEEDLHLHVHLENNILFPKALELEKKLDQ
ncbi:MAG: iron-sulfur cluster repair di-iron protein [Bacteroidota bacterium]|nr:iron-sulfur cluster repair di-iron protein [Bacteroidota bacterium]MDP4216622.1 iron-sulfur cluster repair di-iron protein [Bacteroidota bacterium]MDP4246948.1 iron-sulfur cluster repair di-iron protein [Bacteroidota bacterium]MDP4255294.1 iron-sulfur cluster repair di-iron protein [Bacteroidota bacterium]MDP4260542.1 iron-sulfur cluster repair di-iron protein [Bacteroidota bacterium]